MKLPGYELRVLEALREHELVARTLISGMFPAGLAQIRAAEPALRLGWSVPRVRRDYTTDMLTAIPALAILTGYRAMLPAPRARGAARRALRRDHGALARRHAARSCGPCGEGGGELYVWTVDDARMIAKLTAMGVDGIITNDPRLFSRSRQRSGAEAGRVGAGEARVRAASSAAWPTAAPSCRAATGSRRRRAASTAGLPATGTSWKLRAALARRAAPRRPRTNAGLGARPGRPTRWLVASMVLQAEAHVHLVAARGRRRASSRGCRPCRAGRRGCTRRSSPTVRASASSACALASARAVAAARGSAATMRARERPRARWRAERRVLDGRHACDHDRRHDRWRSPVSSRRRAGCGISVGDGGDALSGRRRAARRGCPSSRRSSAAICERIAEVAVPRSFEPGQAVFREGDASDTCYVVREGHARAIRTHGDGRTITLATFGPGDIFGELAMFEDERRSATVEAIEPTSVVGVLGPDMRRLMGEHPRDRHAPRDRARPAPARDERAPLAPVLPDRAEPRRGRAQRARRARRSPTGKAGADVLVTATQADLAQLAGSSRESASRFLAVLERAGRDLPGARPPGRPRPRGAEAVCLLSRRAAPDARRARRRASSPPAGVVVRDERGRRDRADAPRRRRLARAGAAEGPRRPRRDAGRRPRSARCARRRASSPSRERARRDALLVPARRPHDRQGASRSSSSSYVEGDIADHDDEVEEVALDRPRARPRRELSHAAEREMVGAARWPTSGKDR